MPHVSSKKLDKKLSDKLFRKLLKVLENAKERSNFYPVVNELFTVTEKIMLAKRLAVVLMLSDNLPQHRISEILKVSPSTVARLSLAIEIGKYNSILKISQGVKSDLEKIIWNILTVGGYLPPKAGKRYWTKYRK